MTPMELNTRIRRVLLERDEYERRIESCDERLTTIMLHQKTLACLLAPKEDTSQFLLHSIHDSVSDALLINDNHPFHLLNLGQLPCHKQMTFYASGLIYPIGYKILRKYKKHDYSNSPHPEIFYTTSILCLGTAKSYSISDDDNNVCTGINAFKDFSGWFTDGLPFRDIEDWLGLRNEEVLNMVRSMGGYDDLLGDTKSNSILDGYFMK